MTHLCHSRLLKRNIGEKWVKYIINKNIGNSRRSSYYLQQSLTRGQQPPKHFELYFFLYEIYGFYHINKDIFELPLLTIRLRLESKKCFFSWSYSYFVSTRCLKFSSINFFFLFTKNFFFHTETVRENNFCRLSLMLLNAS